MLGLCCCTWAFCGWGKRGLLSSCRLFVAVAFVFAEHKLQSVGSVVVEHGFSCLAACGIFPDQGLKLCPLH